MTLNRLNWRVSWKKLRHCFPEVLPCEIAEQIRRFMKELNLRSLKHELRTPVNHILGYSELLLESAQDAGDETLMTQARGIHSNGRKLVELIDRNLASDGHMETVHMGELWADRKSTRLNSSHI